MDEGVEAEVVRAREVGFKQEALLIAGGERGRARNDVVSTPGLFLPAPLTSRIDA